MSVVYFYCCQYPVAARRNVECENLPVVNAHIEKRMWSTMEYIKMNVCVHCILYSAKERQSICELFEQLGREGVAC